MSVRHSLLPSVVSVNHALLWVLYTWPIPKHGKETRKKH
jgi:hypothetical protein